LISRVPAQTESSLATIRFFAVIRQARQITVNEALHAVA